MSMQMKLDEMLEELGRVAPDSGARFKAALEAIGTEMASRIATHHDCEHGEATFQGIAFAGTCAPFMPRYRGQPFPEGWEQYDDGGREEWESVMWAEDLPPMTGADAYRAGLPVSANPFHPINKPFQHAMWHSSYRTAERTA